MKKNNLDNDTVLTYEFSKKEVEALLLLFRSVSVPERLYKFQTSLDSYVYKNMTIEEAESLFRIGGKKIENG